MTIIYNVITPADSNATLATGGTTRYGIELNGPTGALVGKQISTFTVSLKKSLTPSGNVTATVRRASDDAAVATFQESPLATSLTTSFLPYVFTLAIPYTLQNGDKIQVEYSGAANIMLEVYTLDQFDGALTRRVRMTTGTYATGNTNDIVATIADGIFASSTITSLYDIRRLASSITISKYDIRQLAPSMTGGIYFDGVDDFINPGSPAILNNLDDFTMSVWIYPTQKNASSTPHIWNKLYPSNNGIILYFTTNSWIVNFRTVGNTGTGVGAQSTFIELNGGNKWYHVMVTFVRSTGAMKLYINGVLRSSGTNAGLLTNGVGGSSDLTINGGSVPIKWGGSIRDFRLWRSNQDAAFTKIYNDDPTAPTPDYWLKMDEGTGNPVDNIGGTLTGILTNGARWLMISSLPLISKYNIRQLASSSIKSVYDILVQIFTAASEITSKYNIHKLASSTITSLYDIIKKDYKPITVIRDNRFTSKQRIPGKYSFMRSWYDRNWGDNSV